MCLLVQIENLDGMAQLDEISRVDGVFIGPADLSTSMGHRGNPGDPEVQSAIENAIIHIQKAGKAAGILSADQKLASRYIKLGAKFFAAGVDTTVLMRGLHTLTANFKETSDQPTSAGGVH